VLLASFISLFTATLLYSFEVTHQVRPHSSFFSSALSQSCSTMKDLPFSSSCNPALFPYDKRTGLYLSAQAKSDGNSINNAKDLVFEPITTPILRRIFAESNFNSLSFNSELAFKNNLFQISYSPYYILADLYLTNPSFPEVSLNLLARESLSLTSGHRIYDNQKIELSVGARLSRISDEYENTHFTLFDLSLTSAEKLIILKKRRDTNADIGTYAHFKDELHFLPDIALQLKNTFGHYRLDRSRALSLQLQETAFLLEPYSTLGLGKSWRMYDVPFSANLEVPFYGTFHEMAPHRLQLGLNSALKLMNISLSVGKYYQNIGLGFLSGHFNVGLFYSSEKDLGHYSSTKEQSVYVGVDAIL
jgi:hypothetical protein